MILNLGLVLLRRFYCVIWGFLQDKLQNLAGQHSDVLETLTPKVRKRVEVLRELQVCFLSYIILLAGVNSDDVLCFRDLIKLLC